MEAICAVVGLSTEPFAQGELAEVLSAARCERLRNLEVCKGHPLLLRIVATLNSAPEDASRAAALRILALLSRVPANLTAVAAALEQVGDSFEKFVQRCAEPAAAKAGEGEEPLGDAVFRDLVTLLMCTSEFSLRGSQVLELCDGRMHLTVAALSAVLRGPYGLEPMETLLKGESLEWESEARVFVCATKNLADLTFCDTYFQSTDERDYQSTDMADLNREFQENLGQVAEALVQLPVIDTATVQLDSWFGAVQKGFGRADKFMRMCGQEARSLPPASDPATRLLHFLECALMNILTTVCNLLSAGGDCSAKLRRHLATHTILVQNLVLPYMSFLIEHLELELTPADKGEPHQHVQQHVRQVLHIVKVLSFVTFEVRLFRDWFAKNNFTPRLLRLRVLAESNLRGELLALLARLNVNIDAAAAPKSDCGGDGPAEAGVVEQLLEAHRRLSVNERRRIAHRLDSPGEAMCPVDRFSSTYALLRPLWEEPADCDGDDDEPEPPLPFRFEFHFAARGGCGFNYSRGGRGCRGRGQPALFGRVRWGRKRKPLGASRHRARMRLALERRWGELRGRGRGRRARPQGQEEEDSAEEEEEEEGASAIGAALTAVEDAAAPAAAPAAPATAPAAAPADSSPGATAEAPGKVLEVATEERRKLLLAPALGSPRHPGSPSKSAVSVHRPTRLAPLRRAPGVPPNSLFGRALAEPDPEPAGEAAAEETKVLFRAGEDDGSEDTSEPSPSGSASAAAVVAEPAAPTPDLALFRSAAPPADVPPAYLCALTHQLITDPVISPHGDVFERSAILRWLAGTRQCPVTGKDLIPSDLLGDPRLRREIEEWRFRHRFQRL
eukprot:TRINITY_DN2984_c0_g1_i1.p1 TRINITY_DN2984_c0_g1~~TRINITY_DN2984_c0_g1_i1.p1  ORF type:complete len:843 (+),score=266.66 TRINITY_DN2984_c0_g1_i1:74-2602(+)